MLDFVFVGPMKTGTSWIHEYLSWHSDVSVPVAVKETYYFSKNLQKGEAWFNKQFDNSSGKKLKGEVGPTYFTNSDAAELIHKRNPKSKIIITLREPCDRFLSHYHHNVRGGFIKKGTPLDEAYRNMNGMRGHSEYYDNIVLWQKKFGVDQVSVLFYEDLDNKPQEFIADICNILEIEGSTVPEELKQKVGERRAPKNASVLQYAGKAAKYLRKKDMHFVVNLVKKYGVRDMLYSKKSLDDRKIEGFDEIASTLIGDSERLEKSLRIDISQWQEIWNAKHLK